MTAPYKILASHLAALGFDLPSAIDDHIAALTKHQRETGTPAPAAPHHFVERAVLRVQSPGKADLFVPHWAIENDLPPEPTLDDKKDALEQKLRMYTSELIAIVSPTRRSAELEHIYTSEAMALDEDKRSPEQAALVKIYFDRQERLKKIHRYMAENLHTIEELTAENIDSFKPVLFAG